MKVAISGLSGVGSTTTARLVSERLNLPMSNYTFRSIAKREQVTLEEILEKSKTSIEYDLEVDRYLIKFGLEHPDCIICTDFAGWLDDPKVYQRLGLEKGITFDLKIWLEAALEIRAQRMSQREQRTIEQLKVEEHQRDLLMRDRLLKLYDIDWFDHSNFDWSFNTEQLSLEQVVKQIVERIELVSQK